MLIILSLRRPKGSQTVLHLSQSDGNGSEKIDILAEFEETEKTRKIIVGRAMKHKAPISTEKWDDVAKDKDKIEAAYDKVMHYLSEFNSQMTKATAEAAPTQHAIAEAKYGQDLGNPFGGIAVWYLLTSTAQKHEQVRIDVMLEELTLYVDSNCKRAIDMAAYLQKINMLFIELTKAGANVDVLQSRTLSRVLGKISQGRHVGPDRLDCIEWQKIGIKAAAWVDKRDPTTVTWQEVFLDLTTTYDAIFAHTRSRLGGDPSRPEGVLRSFI